MAGISIKLNLTQLKHVQREINGKDGNKVKCLIIPIVENDLFQGEKGIYLDMQAIEIKNKVGDSKDTHLVKQSFDKDKYAAMSDEQKQALPILGNAIYWGRREAEPQQSSSIPASFDSGSSQEEHDDLPFG